MASLPENWESDYDGDRWFFRFKPTGLVQYTFPKPGDEFPEFVDVFSPPLQLSPEEKLESHYQVKRRNTAGGSGSASQAGKSKDGLTSATMAGPGDDDGNFWYQPDGLMYMGPGGYTDISPEEEDEAESAGFQHQENKDSATGGEAGSKQLEAGHRSNISPVISAESTPLGTNSHPATSPPLNNIDTVVDVGDAGRTDGSAAESPDGVPLLDGRQIQSPVGYMPELASELTAQCREETHPAPVELPTHDMTGEAAAQPFIYANAFDMAPVELPAHKSPVVRHRQAHDTGLGADQKVLIPPLQDPHKTQSGAPTAHQPPQTHQAQAPVRQNSMPLPTAEPSQSFTMPAQPTPGKYQAYKPGRHVAAEGEGGVRHNPGPGMGGDYFATRGVDGGNLGANAKRYSLAGPIPPRSLPENVPAVLQPPQVPPKQPLGRDEKDNYMLPGSGARHESISDHVGPRLVPSILQPAGGRAASSVARPSLQDHRAHSTPNYQPYNPYRDLEEHIESTAQLYSQPCNNRESTPMSVPSGQVHPSMARPLAAQASPEVKPVFNTSRANTLPFEMPALPYMGVNPSHRAPAVQTIPESSHQPANQLPTTARPGGSDQGGKMAVFGDYSSPKIQSPDFPEPLKSFHKQATDASNSRHHQSDAAPLAHLQFNSGASQPSASSGQQSNVSTDNRAELSQACQKEVAGVNPPVLSSFQVPSGQHLASSNRESSYYNAQGRPVLPHQQNATTPDRKTRIQSLDSAAGNTDTHTAPTTTATRRVSLSDPSHGFIVQSSAMPPPSVQSLRNESAGMHGMTAQSSSHSPPTNGIKDPRVQAQMPPTVHAQFVTQQPTPGSQFHQRDQGSGPKGRPASARPHPARDHAINNQSSAAQTRHSPTSAQGGVGPVPRPVSVVLQAQEASRPLHSRPVERLPTPQPVPLPTPPTTQQAYMHSAGTQSTGQPRRIPLPVPVPQPSPAPRPSSSQPPSRSQAPPRPDKTPTTHAQTAIIQTPQSPPSNTHFAGPAGPTAARHGVLSGPLPPPGHPRTVQGSTGQPGLPESSQIQPGPAPAPAISSGPVKAPPHMQTQRPSQPLSSLSMGTYRATATANPIMQQPSTEHIVAPIHPTMTQQAGFVQPPGISPQNPGARAPQPSMHAMAVGGMGAPHAMYFPAGAVSQQPFQPQGAMPLASQPHASPGMAAMNQAENCAAQNTGAGRERDSWFGKVFKSGSVKKQNPVAGIAPASNDNKSAGGRSTPDSTTRSKLQKSQPTTTQMGPAHGQPNYPYTQVATPAVGPVVGPPVLMQGNTLGQPSGPYFQPATGIPQWATPQTAAAPGGHHFLQQGAPRQQQQVAQPVGTLVSGQFVTYPPQSHPPQNGQFGQPQEQRHVKQNQSGQPSYRTPVEQQKHGQLVDRTQRYPGNMPHGNTNPGVPVSGAGRTASSPPDAAANRHDTSPNEALGRPAQPKPRAPEHNPHHPSEPISTTVRQGDPSKGPDAKGLDRHQESKDQDKADRDSLSRKSIASSIAPSFTNSITTESAFTTARHVDNDIKTDTGSADGGALSAVNDKTGVLTTASSAPGNYLTSTGNAQGGIGDVSAVGEVSAIGSPATSVSDIAVATGEDSSEPASPPTSAPAPAPAPTPAPASKWDSSGYDGSGWGDEDEDEYDYDGGYGRGGYGGYGDGYR